MTPEKMRLEARCAEDCGNNGCATQWHCTAEIAERLDRLDRRIVAVFELLELVLKPEWPPLEDPSAEIVVTDKMMAAGAVEMYALVPTRTTEHHVAAMYRAMERARREGE